MPAVSGDSAARAALGWNFPEADFLIPVAQITALYECRVLRPKPRTSVNARRQGRSKLHDSGSLQCPCGRPATRVGAGSWRSARPVSQAALDERRPLKFEHLGVLWKELSVERLGGRKLALFLIKERGRYRAAEKGRPPFACANGPPSPASRASMPACSFWAARSFRRAPRLRVPSGPCHKWLAPLCKPPSPMSFHLRLSLKL